MGNKVDRIQTNISESEMAQGIISAWNHLFGQRPTREQVSLVLAQNNLETGHRKNMWNYNVGNITTDGKGQYDYWEGLDWLYDYFHHKKTINLKYRAYPTLQAGIEDYLKLLSKPGGRYADAWKHIMNPDPVAFSKALKAGGYYGASEEQYTKNVVSLYNQSKSSNVYDKAINNIKDEPKNNEIDNLDNILDKYLQGLSAMSSSSFKKMCKKALPSHNILIKISNVDYNSAVEFSGILCNALDEELLSSSYPHTDGQSEVEVECKIHGSEQDCFAAVQQMTNTISDIFKEATLKVGGISVATECIMNEKSFYYPMNFNSIGSNHRKFLLKFVKGE